MRRVDAGANCCCAEIDLLNQCARFCQPQQIFFDHDGISRELLTQCHRHCVLQLSATNFEDGFEFNSLRVETCSQNFHRTEQPINRHPKRESHCRWVDVVGALRRVDVIIRMQRVVATLLQPHDLKRHVGDDLVGVHVG